MIGRWRRNPHTETPVHHAIPVAHKAMPLDMTPDHERRRVMADRLHRVWHSTPCAAPPHIRCELLTRAYLVVQLLDPLVAMYLAEAVERARADLTREWGE